MKIIDKNVDELIRKRINGCDFKNNVAKVWRRDLNTGEEEYSEILFSKENNTGYVWVKHESAPYIQFKKLDIKIPSIIEINKRELIDYLWYLACDMQTNPETDE